MSQYDTAGLHDFMANTPEAGLRKMLIDKVKVTDVHFNLLVKIVRACKVEEFSEHFEKQSFPKVRLGPAEAKIQERFWNDCTALLLERGLLQPAMPVSQKVAA